MMKLCFARVRFGAIVNAWIGSRYLLVLSLYFFLLDCYIWGVMGLVYERLGILYTRVPPFVDGGFIFCLSV